MAVKLTDTQRQCLKEAQYSSVSAPQAGPYRRRGELGRRGCFSGPTIRSLLAKEMLTEVFPGALRITPAGRQALQEQG